MQTVSEHLRSESRTIVRHVVVNDDSVVKRKAFKVLNSSKGLNGIQMFLQFNMKMTSGGVNKNTTTTVVGRIGSSGRFSRWVSNAVPLNSSSSGGANEMIDEHPLVRLQLICRENIIFVREN